MKQAMTGWLMTIVVVLSGGSLLAHHSLANHDTTQAVRVKGTILEFHAINPHSIIYVEEKTGDGKIRRWAVEGPSGFQIGRMGLQDVVKLLKPGDVIEVCGYMPKEAVMWQIASADPRAQSLSGRLINAEMLVLPEGKVQSWGDYGFHKCFPPDFDDGHVRRVR